MAHSQSQDSFTSSMEPQPVPLHEFAHYVSSIQQRPPYLATCKSTDLEQEFDLLWEFDRTLLDNYERAIGNDGMNDWMNRVSGTRPFDHNRVVLRLPPAATASDYINASHVKAREEDKQFIAGYKQFIAAEAPLSHTRGIFVQMLIEQQVEVVVMLNEVNETAGIDCPQYWPSQGGHETTFGEFLVQVENETDDERYSCYTERLMRLKHKNDSDWHRVTQLQFKKWPENSPPEPGNFIAFFKEARALIAASQKPSVVHCSTGCGSSGAFIALCWLVSRVEAGVHRCITQRITQHQQRQCLHQLAAASPQSELRFIYEFLRFYLAEEQLMS